MPLVTAAFVREVGTWTRPRLNYHLGVLLRSFPNPPAQVNDTLHTLGGQEGVAEYLVCLLPYAVDAARPLNKTDNCPRQVVNCKVPNTGRVGSAGRIRTYDQSVNSRPLYH